MNALRRAVATFLATLTVAFSAGISPYEALAQNVGPQAGAGTGGTAIGAAAGGIGGVGVAPAIQTPLIVGPGGSTLGATGVQPVIQLQAPITVPAGIQAAGTALPEAGQQAGSLALAPTAAPTGSFVAPRPQAGRIADAAPQETAGTPAARSNQIPTGTLIARVSNGVATLGKSISGGLRGQGLSRQLGRVFENSAVRAAEEPPVKAEQPAAPAPSSLKPSAPTPVQPDAAPAKPATPTAPNAFAKDFAAVFIEPLWTPLKAALRGAASAATYPVRHPILSARAVGSALVQAGSALRHPIRTLQAARTAVPEAFKAGLRKVTGGAVSSLAEFTPSEKAYLTGQAVFLFAISVYLASLPMLVTALTGDPAMTGVARAVHYWSFGIASLFSGRIVRSTPMRLILGGGALTRAAAFGIIGLLAFGHMLSWQAFLILAGANALIVALNHLVDIDTNGAKKVFDSDEKIEKAGYVYDFIFYGMMLIVPPVLGLGMDAIDTRYGPGAGAFTGFTLFAAVMGVVSWIYTTKVKIIGEKLQSWSLELMTGPARRWGIGLIAAGSAIAGSTWLALGTAALLTPLGLGGLALGALAAISGVIALFHWDTLAVIFKNKAVFARWTMATAENFVEDALFAVVLPTFALEILGVAAFGNGLILSAITLGGLIASKLLVSRAKDHQKRMGTYRFLGVLTAGASLAFIPSIGLWTSPTLLMALPLVFLMKYLYQPIRSRMRALLQVSIKNDPESDKRSEDIYGLMSVVEVIAAGAGGLAFAWLFQNSRPGSPIYDLLGADSAMKVVTIVLAGMSLVYLLGLHWVKGQLSKPEHKIHASDPDPVKAAAIEAAAYVKLSANLAKMGLKPYETQVVEEAVSEDRPTVAILAPGSTHKLAMALEGGRQSAGDVHLVLDPSWFIQEVHPGERTTLLLKKGLYFTADGQAVIAEYKVPRRVRYWGNWYTLGANDRADGVPLEENADVPQSSSMQLEAATNDKLGTRLLMAARRVGVPATLAFLMPQHPVVGRQADGMVAPSVYVETMAPIDQRRAQVEEAVTRYLESFRGEEIVVKPSGPQFHSGRGVKFFKAGERAAIITHAMTLSADPMMTEDGSVLIDERVPSLEIRRDRKMETTLRVLVSRTPWGEGVVSGIFARVGPWGKPTTAEAADPRDNASVDSWSGLLAEWVKNGQLTEEQAQGLDEKVRAMGPGAFQAITEAEHGRERKSGEPYQAQTDLIGLDVMIARRPDGSVEPMIIEVNDHDSGGQYNLEFELKEGTEHSAAYVATWLARARRDALKGKRIVLLGAGYAGNAGYPGKKLFFDRAKELGVKIVLIDKPGSWAKDLVSEFIPIDTTKPEAALAKAKKKLQRSARKNGKLDGITTFWEDDVMLTAKLARDLGLPYHTEEAAEAARNKFALRTAMEKAGLPSPAYDLVRSREALEAMFAARREQGDPFPFPAVLKPARGAAAQGTMKAMNETEALAMFDRIYEDMDPAKDSIFKQGREVLIDQYLNGEEGDVDVVWQGGKAAYAKDTDNWPTMEPFFLATGSSSPGRVLNAKERQDVLDLSAKTLAAVGFGDGVFHVEYKYTDRGPRLIEVNARPGGVYVVPWNLAVWGVDLAEMLFATAAGIPAVPYAPAKPRTHLEGEFLIPGQSGKLERFHMEPAETKDGFYDLLTLKLVGSDVSVPPNGYDRVGMLVANGRNAVDAQVNLDKQRARLTLEIKPK